MLESIDAYKPQQIAKLVEDVGIKKAELAFLPMLTLSILAGAFIAFGAMFYTLTITGSELGYGPTKLLGGITFSLGLVLVVVAGAELFTGNNLIVIAWADNKVSTVLLLRNWLVVYFGNFIGALMSAWLVYLSGILSVGDGSVFETLAKIVEGKLALDWLQAFTRGMLCNALVCLAVWLCFSARLVSGKILAIIFPISAFVALGFEHSVANMYFIPLAFMESAVDIDLYSFMYNLLWVTLGNIFGGSVFVAIVYWICYIRGAKQS
jgi:formate/nitrite transporter